MKKTVNINLAGTFFHIDEDAFGKLSRYLEAIKKSLSDPQGSDEIIRDIEARIAELFSEKIETSSQVISIKELDEVIAVMGQPEDYMVDEEIFDDAPPPASKRSRTSYNQLFRDIDNKFIGGVSSGLAHYLKIDAIWIRLLWILLTIVTQGTFIITYIIFWILVPAATSVSDKLKMNREAVNISNIEKKFKESYENVADGIKNADYDAYGKRIKNGSAGFFETVGKVIMVILKVFVKILGVFMIFIALATLVSLIIGVFTVGSVGIWNNAEALDMFNMVNTTEVPIWVFSLLALFAVGIPFFVLLILGLKLIVNNLKSIGTKAKIALFILWLASLIALAVIGINQATETAYDGDTVIEQVLTINPEETLNLVMVGNDLYDDDSYRNGSFKVKYNENDEKLIYSRDVRLIIRSTKDSIAKIKIRRSAEGSSSLEARKHAEKIDYSYTLVNNTLKLNDHFTIAIENKYHDQEVEVIVYLPVGTMLMADENTRSYHRNYDRHRDILFTGQEGYQLLVEDGRINCLDCPEEALKNTDDSMYYNSFENDDDAVDINEIIINTPDDTIRINVDVDENGTMENGSWETEVNNDFNEKVKIKVTKTKDSI